MCIFRPNHYHLRVVQTCFENKVMNTKRFEKKFQMRTICTLDGLWSKRIRPEKCRLRHQLENSGTSNKVEIKYRKAHLIKSSRACCKVGNLKEKPASINLFGITLWPLSTTFANSPSRVRRKKAGTAGRRAGRPSVIARIFANSAFLTGFGATQFTGPEISLSLNRSEKMLKRSSW